MRNGSCASTLTTGKNDRITSGTSSSSFSRIAMNDAKKRVTPPRWTAIGRTASGRKRISVSISPPSGNVEHTSANIINTAHRMSVRRT